MPRKKGSKNKGKNVNGNGGDRRSMAFKLKKLEEKMKKEQFFEKKMSSKHNNIAKEINHPLCKDNIIFSQNCLKDILKHPSMPSSSNISNYCIVTESDDSKEDNNYNIHDECAVNSIENDNTIDDVTYFKTSYMPGKETPLGIYLDNVKTKLKK